MKRFLILIEGAIISLMSIWMLAFINATSANTLQNYRMLEATIETTKKISAIESSLGVGYAMISLVWVCGIFSVARKFAKTFKKDIDKK